MSDLTSSFKDLCSDFSRNIGAQKQQQTKNKRSILNDTFQDESEELKRHLAELKTLIIDIKPLYLANDKNLMSPIEIKQLDDDIKIQLKDFTNKFNFLQHYEVKRYNTLLEQKSNFKLNSFINKAKEKVFNEKSKDSANGTYDEQVNLSSYRQGCLSFLSLKIVEISELFADLQKDKFLTDKKLNDLDFNAIHDQINTNRNAKVNNDLFSLENAAFDNVDKITYSTGYSRNNEDRENEAKEYQETIQKLTQEQVQELQVENDNILQEKDYQLDELNQISTKLFEISSLTSELNLQLSQQSQNINLILDNQDTINLELKQANRQLNSKSGKMNFSAVIVSYMAVILGIIIIFLDYIN
ncbi:hypothetical protein QEN19_002187 [Hanseniaspora menglaensis]